MLITKEVEITLHPRNMAHYEDLGYEIPRYRYRKGPWYIKKGTKLKVKVNDLPNGSPTKIKYRCSDCGSVFCVKYKQYMKRVNKPDLCNHCSSVKKCKDGTGIKRPDISGRNCHLWKGGKTTIQSAIRSAVENSHWRLKVYERDKFTCRNCGDDKGHVLNAHHIVNLAHLIDEYKINKDNYLQHKDKIYNISNGATLCKTCHMRFHSINGSATTQKQLEEFLNEKS